MHKSLLLILLLILLPLSGYAKTAEEKGLAIIVEADKRDTGWGDQSSSLQMVLRNRHGQETRREIRTRTLEMQNDGDKSVNIFDNPRDVKGTAFLSFTHAIKPDDQWLYLPALKRVKRISSANKSGPFMGSEFAYEDITSQEIEKYKYKYLKEETAYGRKTFVIEFIPQYKHSGYTRQIVWLDQNIYRPIKIDFYDRKNTLLKTLTYHDYQQYLGKYWRADRMEMVNQQNGKSTTLLLRDYKFKTGLKERNFNKNSLKRIR